MARPRRSITAFGPAMMGGLRSSGRPLRPLVKSKPRSPRRRLRLRTVTTTLIRASRSTRIRAMRHPTPGLRRRLLPLAMSPQLRARRRPARPSRDNKWPDGTRVMVRNKPKSWSEATVYTRLDAEYWRVQYPSGGTGMFKEGDLRAYDAERDAKRARQPRRARAAGPRPASRSRYALDPAVIAAGKLPDRAPVVTSAANPHYQKRFDELHKLAAAGDWAAVRDYKVSGSNSYSKLVARYQQDLLALHAASGDAQ